MQTIFGLNPAVFIILLVWSMIWKGIALWKSGRNSQLTWFVVLFIVNTVGLVEIIYLAFFQKPKPEAKSEVKEVEKKAAEKRPAKKKR